VIFRSVVPRGRHGTDEPADQSAETPDVSDIGSGTVKMSQGKPIPLERAGTVQF